MIELLARSPTRIAPRGDCFSNRFWGSRRLHWDERKWTRQRVRQRARTAVHDPFQADRPEWRCSRDIGCSFQNRAPRTCASRSAFVPETAPARWKRAREVWCQLGNRNSWSWRTPNAQMGMHLATRKHPEICRRLKGVRSPHSLAHRRHQ